MKNRNGFTLIELLAAIVILGIISLIVFPTVNKTIKNQKNKLYERQVATIKEAAESWAVKNTGKLPNEESSDKVYAGVRGLVKAGFLEKNKISDPKKSGQNNEMNGCVIIEYDSSNNQYEYTFNDLGKKNDDNCDVEKIKYCTLSDCTEILVN